MNKQTKTNLVLPIVSIVILLLAAWGVKTLISLSMPSFVCEKCKIWQENDEISDSFVTKSYR